MCVSLSSLFISFTLALYLICLFRLQKTLLEKEDRERKLKELQDSLLAMKKHVPASDSSSRVIHISITRQNSDYISTVWVEQNLYTHLHARHSVKSPYTLFFNVSLGASRCSQASSG